MEDVSAKRSLESDSSPTSTTSEDEVNWKAELERILALGKAGKSRQCIDKLRGFVEKYPECGEAWGHLGFLLLSLKKPAEALACYERVLALHPDHLEAYEWVGHCYYASRKYDAAHRSYSRLKGTPRYESKVIQDLIRTTRPISLWSSGRIPALAASLLKRLPDPRFLKRFGGELLSLPGSVPGIRAAGYRKYLTYLSRHYLQTYDYLLATSPCDLCGSTDFRTIFFFGSQKKVKCVRCGLECVERRPHHSVDVAQSTYDTDDTIEYFEQLWADSENLLGRAEALTRLFEKTGVPFPNPGARAFEIGCLHGRFLKYMADHGMDVSGIETSFRMSEYARRELGLNVSRGTVREFEEPDDSYDLVLAYHVAEHLDRPSILFSKAARMLRSGGFLFVEVPVPDLMTLPLTMQLDDWHGYGNENHLYYFHPTHIRLYFERHGFLFAGTYEYPSATGHTSAGFLGQKVERAAVTPSGG